MGRRSYDVSVAEAWDFPWEFGASGDDEPDAYRSSPVSDVAYSVFFFVDTDGVVRAGVPRGLNFGLRAAVVQYCRKPALVVAFLRRILMVPAHHYVDDFQVAEPSFCLGPEVPGATKLHQRFPASGQGMLWATYDLLGFRPLKPEKSSPWSSSAAPFIGTVSDFSELPTKGVVSISIKEETRIKARDLVRGALDTKVLAPQTAGKLYGKLRWVFCLGKVCLGALSEIKSRQYEGDPDCGDGALSDSLTEALHFLLHVLGEDALPAKLRTYSTRRPVLIWSDARWEKRQGMPFGFGRIGYVVRVPRLEGGYDTFFALAEVPEEILKVLHTLRSHKTFIHPLELVGILAPYFSPVLRAYLGGADVIHFGDNQAANGVAIKGASGAPDLARLALLFHSRLAADATRVWIEWVCSAGNPADAPSRVDLSSLLEAGASQLDFVFPDLLSAFGIGV